MRQKIILFSTLLILSACHKQVLLKQNGSVISYIEPMECEFKEPNYTPYNIEIKDNYFIVQEKDIDNIIVNIHKYKQAHQQVLQCYKNNDQYYKDVIQIINS